jgi:tetratricopeptide (TPR) repeat protein
MLPNSPASEALAERLTEETGGSPAFISDMLRGLVDEGVMQRDGDRWHLSLPPEEISRSHLPLPPTLRTSLQERVTPIDDHALQVAQTIAMSRRGLSLDTVIRAVDLDEDEVMECIDELVDANIVRERREGDEEFVELCHARLSDILIEGLSPEERQHQHRRLGELLEQVHRHRLTLVVEDLAFHFEQAGVPPKAYAYLIQTAKKHLRRSLHEAGLHYLDRAIRMAPEARPFLLLEEADRRQCEAHIARGSALLNLGQPDEAMAAVQRARHFADAVRSPTHQARVRTMLGDMHRNLGNLVKAETNLVQALDFAQQADVRALRPMPLYHLGAILWSRGELEQAQANWEEARDLAQELRNERAEGRAFNGLGILEFCKGRPASARKLLEKSSEIFERLGMLEPLAVTRVNLIELYLSTGMLRRAFNLADRTSSQAREVGHLHGVSMGLVWRARLLLVLGRPEEARRNALEALRIATELRALDEQIVSLTTLVQVMLALGLGSFAKSRAEQLLDILGMADYEGVTPLVRALLAQIHVASHEPDAARAMLTVEAPQMSFPHIQVRIDLDVATAWRMLGESAQAEHHGRQALEVAQRSRFRFYELIAHHELSQATEDHALREQHARKAKSLARSLSASLDRFDGATFVGRGWGVPR